MERLSLQRPVARCAAFCNIFRTRPAVKPCMGLQVACANLILSAKSTCVHPERKDPQLCMGPSDEAWMCS